MEASAPDRWPRLFAFALGSMLLLGCNSEEAPPSSVKSTASPTNEAADDLPVAKRDPKSIRIATWNLEWLTARQGEGAVKRTQAEFEILAAYASALGADLIGVQEVEDEAALAKVFDPSLYDFHV